MALTCWIGTVVGRTTLFDECIYRRKFSKPQFDKHEYKFVEAIAMQLHSLYFWTDIQMHK